MIMSAIDARELSDKAVHLTIQEQSKEVQETIEQAINNGKYFCTIVEPHDQLLVKLRELGYTITPLNPVSYKVSWSLK